MRKEEINREKKKRKWQEESLGQGQNSHFMCILLQKLEVSMHLG